MMRMSTSLRSVAGNAESLNRRHGIVVGVAALGLGHMIFIVVIVSLRVYT